MKASTTKRAPRLSPADRRARTALLDAFDAMPTSALRHVVAGNAVIMADMFGTAHAQAPVVITREWHRLNKGVEPPRGALRHRAGRARRVYARNLTPI